MVSCLLTRVIVNVSIALTIQCYKPDGSIYNKTICSMLPPNMAKMEILKQMFLEKNLSIPDNLVTTPVVLLESASRDEDFYVDNEKKKDNTRQDRLRSSRVHSYSIMKDDKCEAAMREKSKFSDKNETMVAQNFPKDDLQEKQFDKNCETTTEQEYGKDFNKTKSKSKTEESPMNKLSLHDQLALSLERQMQIIDAQEDNVKDKPYEQTTPDEVYTTIGPIVCDNVTHPVEKEISEFTHKYKDAVTILSLSEEMKGHQGETGTSIREKRTINTENVKYAFELTEEGVKQTERFLKDQMENEHNCTAQQRSSHDEDVTESQINRIEKRSIPNTHPDVQLDENKTIESSNDYIREKERPTESMKSLLNAFPGANDFWNVFVTSPVEAVLNSTKAYERFGTELDEYEKEYYDKLVQKLKGNEKEPHLDSNGLNPSKPHFEHTTSNTQQEEFGKEYYAQLMQNIREKEKEGTFEHNVVSHTLETENYKQTLSEQTTSNIQNDPQSGVSEELENLMDDFENPTSVEKNVARKILEKLKTKTTRHIRDRLGSEKYAEYLALKKSLDDQYRDIQAHLNETSKGIKNLFIDMRNLKEEKANNDFFKKNEHLFKHLTTPVNYTDVTIHMKEEMDPMMPDTSIHEWNSTEDAPSVNAMDDEQQQEQENLVNHEVLDDDKSLIIRPCADEFNTSSHEICNATREQTKAYQTTTNNITMKIESLERYDRGKYQELREDELFQTTKAIPEDRFKNMHEQIMKRLTKGEYPKNRSTSTARTETRKLWFEESVFDENDPKILYARYLHNVRNMTVRLNMDVGKKNIRNITSFKEEDIQYAHHYKSTTECRRFSHIIPFWLTQPKEIEDVFKGNTKIFREYIQYIIDKQNFTELPVHGRFAFIRRYINKLNNPLIFNRITIFPTVYATTDHVLSLKEQILHFKGHMKSKLHKAYAHVKHFLFNSSTEAHLEPITLPQTETLPEEIIISITTPPPMGPYDYYYQ